MSEDPYEEFGVVLDATPSVTPDLPDTIESVNVGSKIPRRIQELTRLWTENEQSQQQVDKFNNFYESTVLGLDVLINELARMKMIYAEESSKPMYTARYETRGRHSKSAEDEARGLLEDNILSCLNTLNTNSSLDDSEIAYLAENVTEFLIRPILKYTASKIQEYIDSVDMSKYRDNDICVKLANTITNMEKTRQNISDTASKMQTEARVALIMNQILIVLNNHITDKTTLRRIAQAFKDITKQENLDIKWG